MTENERSAEEMFKMIEMQAMPIIQAYIDNPSILDTISPSDIDKDYILEKKLRGVYPAGLPTQTAWMLAVYHENVNPKRAAEFAQRGLAYNGSPVVKITRKLKKMVEDGDVAGSIFGNDPEDEINNPMSTSSLPCLPRLPPHFNNPISPFRRTFAAG